jgi:ABC-2 type transport system permease protein
MRSHIGAIAYREWRTRVRKRSFILGLILLPLLGIGGVVGMALVVRESSVNHEVLVVDHDGLITVDHQGEWVPHCPSCFLEREGLDYRFTREMPVDSVWLAQGFTAVVEFDGDVVQNQSGHLWYESAPGMELARWLERDLGLALEHLRVLETTDLNWPGYRALRFDLNLSTRDIKTGTGGVEIRSIIGFAFSIFLFMFIAIHGTTLMRSVLEEKTSRVVEVLLAVVRPVDLMWGKLIGVAAVALTQFLAWSLLSMTGMALFRSLFNAGTFTKGLPTADLTTLMAENELTRVLLEINWPLMVIATLVYFIGGYVLYGGLYAAAGAASENETEANQFVVPLLMPLLFSYMAGSFAIGNPDLPLGAWLSWIPFTSPVSMLIRVATGVHWAELIGSMALLWLTAWLMIKLAGRIYQVGLLHRGKKPSYRELFKWLRGNG